MIDLGRHVVIYGEETGPITLPRDPRPTFYVMGQDSPKDIIATYDEVAKVLELRMVYVDKVEPGDTLRLPHSPTGLRITFRLDRWRRKALSMRIEGLDAAADVDTVIDGLRAARDEYLATGPTPPPAEDYSPQVAVWHAVELLVAKREEILEQIGPRAACAKG